MGLRGENGHYCTIFKQLAEKENQFQLGGGGVAKVKVSSQINVPSKDKNTINTHTKRCANKKSKPNLWMSKRIDFFRLTKRS